MRILSMRLAVICLAAASIGVLAQKTPRVVVVLPYTQDQLDAGQVPVQALLEEGLRERGWSPGRNLELVYRPTAAIEGLLREPLDVLVTFTDEYRIAMKSARRVPIVAQLAGDPNEVNLLRRLGPESNLTGVAAPPQGSLATKRLALLKEATGVRRVVRLYFGEALRFGTVEEILPEYAAAARALDLEVTPVWAANVGELRAVFAELARRRPIAVLLGPMSRLPGREALWDALLEQMTRYRIPLMSDVPRAASQGAVLGYGDDIPDRARRMAYFVDRILRGAKPGDLPIEQLDQVQLVLNLRAANSIGLTFPPAVVLQATSVIR